MNLSFIHISVFQPGFYLTSKDVTKCSVFERIQEKYCVLYVPFLPMFMMHMNF